MAADLQQANPRLVFERVDLFHQKHYLSQDDFEQQKIRNDLMTLYDYQYA